MYSEKNTVHIDGTFATATSVKKYRAPLQVRRRLPEEHVMRDVVAFVNFFFGTAGSYVAMSAYPP